MGDNREGTVTRGGADRPNPGTAESAASQKQWDDSRGRINRASAVGEERVAFVAAVRFMAAALLGALS